MADYKLVDFPTDMIEEFLRSSAIDTNANDLKEFTVFDAAMSPGVEEEEGSPPDMTVMQPLDPNTLLPADGCSLLEMNVLEAVNEEDWCNLAFAVVAEEEVGGGPFVEAHFGGPAAPGGELGGPAVVTEVVEQPLFDDQVLLRQEEEEEEDHLKSSFSSTVRYSTRSSSRKRTRNTRAESPEPEAPPRKRGRKPLYPPGTPRPRKSRPKKVKLYEVDGFSDPEKERKRLNALNAHIHRQRKKEEKEHLLERLHEVTRERDQLKAQLDLMRERERQLVTELEHGKHHLAVC